MGEYNMEEYDRDHIPAGLRLTETGKYQGAWRTATAQNFSGRPSGTGEILVEVFTKEDKSLGTMTINAAADVTGLCYKTVWRATRRGNVTRSGHYFRRTVCS